MPRPPKRVFISKKEIGERIRAIRQERDMSQADLAELLGVNQPNISAVELGLRGLTIQQLVRLSRALKVPTDEILGEDRHPRESKPLKNPRLLRRIRLIEGLPATQQRAVFKLLDGILESHTNASRQAG